MPRYLDKPTPQEQEALDKLQELYRSGHKGQKNYKSAWGWSYEGDPLVPHPSEFQQDPLVVGGGIDRQRLAMEAKRLLDLDPTTKSRTGKVVYGPTTASINYQAEQGLPRETHNGYHGLKGIADPSRGQIGLMDHSDNRDRRSTLAHEIGHMAGYDQDGAYRAGSLGAMLGDGDKTDDESDAQFSLRRELYLQEARKAKAGKR